MDQTTNEKYILAEKVRIKMARQGRSDLKFLSKKLLHMNDINEKTHRDMIRILESASKRKMIIMPRGSLKSSLGVVAFSIFCLINNPNERILLDSELYTNSKNFLREIKQLLESPIMTLLYGTFKGSTWNESEIIINQRTKTYKEASITVGGIGTQKTGQHFSTIIGDDYSSPSNTNTPENAQKVVAHYRYNTSILEPDGKYVIIGTRYSELDLIGHIKANEVDI